MAEGGIEGNVEPLNMNVQEAQLVLLGSSCRLRPRGLKRLNARLLEDKWRRVGLI